MVFADELLRFRSRSVSDLGDGPGPQLCWVKKEEMTEGKKANRASKSRKENQQLHKLCLR